MSALSVCSSARRRVPFFCRRLTNRRNTPRSSAFLLLDDRKHYSQTMPSWVISVFESPPVVFTEEVLIKFHDVTGLPWWASIAISTIGLRMCLCLPLAIRSDANLARLANLEPEANEIRRILRDEAATAKVMFNWTEKQATKVYNVNMDRHMTRLLERENCHPLKSGLLVLLQIPPWIALSFAFRHMALLGGSGAFEVMTMTTEGFLWIRNLTIPDSTLIFPVLTTLTHLTNAELYNLKSDLPKTWILKSLHNISRIMCFIFIPIGLWVPSALPLYWFCSAISATAQRLLLMSPRFRRLVRIPITEREDPAPYSTVWNNFQKRVIRRKL